MQASINQMELDKPSWAIHSTLVKNHEENKTYILVKLSESFSNAIQEYSAAQNNNNHHHHHYNNVKHKQSSYSSSREPTIRFQGTRGAIKFPDGKSYDFSLEQSENSVECIKQSKTRWESVGKVACCLQVKGKDDVYQMTRTKMKAAEQEKRKYCAKLLGSPENNTISKRTKLLNSNSTKPPPTQLPLQQPPPSLSHSVTNDTTTTGSNSTTTITTTTSKNRNNNSTGKTKSKNNNNNTIINDTNNTSSININNNTNGITNNNDNHKNNSNHSSSIAPQNMYPDIKDIKQLKKYKAEFDKDFQEYQTLHGYLHRIEERFRKLRELLKQSVEGSPGWESAKEQIFNEYERIKSDSNFHRARREYKQLYNKLAQIKEKIFQFKQRKKKDQPVLQKTDQRHKQLVEQKQLEQRQKQLEQRQLEQKQKQQHRHQHQKKRL